MEIVQAVALGIIQGLTEFLPVSSTGHLLLAQKVFGFPESLFGHSFDAAIHLGTLGALLVYFRSEWLGIVRGFFRSLRRRRLAGDRSARDAWLIIGGTVPAVVAGALFQGTIEERLTAPVPIALSMAVFGLVMSAADLTARKRRTLAQLNGGDALIVGVAQAIALVPGVSRSGVTITAGLLRDLKRPDAAHFAFLLSAPVIAGAASKTLFDIARKGGAGGSPSAAVLLAGILSSGIVGYFVIRFLLRFLARNPVHVFTAYRLALAAVILALVVTGRLAA